MRIFLTARAFRRAARAAAPDAQDPAHLLKLYAHNPALLRRALAAYCNVPVETVNLRNVSDQEVLLAPFTRVICALGDGLAEERAA